MSSFIQGIQPKRYINSITLKSAAREDHWASQWENLTDGKDKASCPTWRRVHLAYATPGQATEQERSNLPCRCKLSNEPLEEGIQSHPNYLTNHSPYTTEKYIEMLFDRAIANSMPCERTNATHWKSSMNWTQHISQFQTSLQCNNTFSLFSLFQIITSRSPASNLGRKVLHLHFRQAASCPSANKHRKFRNRQWTQAKLEITDATTIYHFKPNRNKLLSISSCTHGPRGRQLSFRGQRGQALSFSRWSYMLNDNACPLCFLLLSKCQTNDIPNSHETFLIWSQLTLKLILFSSFFSLQQWQPSSICRKKWGNFSEPLL
jgi:hypothetical protein